MSHTIEVYGAREHNLKNIDVVIPRDRLTVITGLSGSGKSSLAFDTIYAEGQRRYIETLSAYARQFIGNMERPDVDKITGLSPVIAIEQKTVNRNPRSTVGTITEIYDFLRLLYARAADAYSMNTGERMVKYTDEQILELIAERFAAHPVYILAPIIKGRKGHYKELFEQIRKRGFLNVRVDGEIRELKAGMKLDRYKMHFIEVVVDKLVANNNDNRLKTSIQTAMKQGKGIIMVMDKDTGDIRYYSRGLMCPTTGLSYNEPAPHTFSFNSPQGACPRCNGLGEVSEVDMEKIIPDVKSNIRKGGIVPLGPAKISVVFNQVEAIAAKYGCTLNTPLDEFSPEALQAILYGTESAIRVKSAHGGFEYQLHFEGIVNLITQEQSETSSQKVRNWANRFIRRIACPECGGARIKQESLHFRIHDKNIAELAAMDIATLSKWFSTVEEHLSEKQQRIAREIIKEIRTRIGFLLDVGLNYLSLSLGSRSLSGGESQRIRLATQIGSQLVNVLYILDEPSIGLHQRDNRRLIRALQHLRDIGNSIIVVEHDREMILSADYVVDMGPAAGRKGGEIIFSGKPKELLMPQKGGTSLTAQYLTGQKRIEIPATRRKGNGKTLTLKGASGNNLKRINVDFPLGTFICVTGVSGSGKSTLINETLQPILSRHFYRTLQEPLPYESIEGLEHIDKVIQVDQSPLGRTPRSNPATYTGVFSAIRDLFARTPESMIRNYQPGRFSFNVKGGRCETCGGAGVQTIEMNFLPDVYVPCSICNGKRYNRETLEVKYNGKSISDVLEMTINMAVEFFRNHPSILPHLTTLQQVGLGYIKLGQPSTTLSGGESQRVKLATELVKRDTGKTFYILDEPTTGLHFDDVRTLLEVLSRLVDRGNTVAVIEHNPDVIKVADHIIDIGPEGGASGGKLICCGTPEEIIPHKKSYTAAFLREELELNIK
ncbi:MAG: excinuclease ABC subunit UvrA [Bacteroidales bacterium]|jgi:excinuclease ABC subunit A|nr:excinuclease ABC subunit UvrA [Bacteroidales bacterium]